MSQDDSDLLGTTPGRGRTVNAFKDLVIRDVMTMLRVGMPASVVTWTPPVPAGLKSKPALVRVQPHFMTVVRMNTAAECTPDLVAEGWIPAQENDGWIRKKPLPQIPNCPVAYTGPAGMLARGPLKPGEVGWLAFCDRSLDKWTQTGGPVDPGFQDMHILNDAVFFPGLRYGVVAKTVDSTKFVVGPEDGSAGLEVDNVTAPALPNIAVKTLGAQATIDALTNILLGGAAALGVARQTDSVTASADMTTFMAQVVTALTTIAAAVPVVIVPPVPPAGAIGTISTASTKVLAE